MAVTLKERVDALGDLVLGKEKINVLPYFKLFEVPFTRMYRGRETYGIRRSIPTAKQWLYVKYYLEGYSQLDAVKKAGYNIKNIKPHKVNNFVSIIHYHKNVQILINAVIGEYLANRRVSAQGLLDKALEVYDRCETVSEQLTTLKFIKSMLPKDAKADRCNLSICPLTKRRKKRSPETRPRQ